MKHLPLGPLCYEFSRHAEPRLRIESGETIDIETEDALSGQIRRPGDRRDRSTVPYSNPVSGPIWVDGAEPGDALAVRIDAIEPRMGRCATYVAQSSMLAEWLGSDVPYHSRICPIRDGAIHWSESIRIPYAPMLGCLGTAPDWGVPSTLPAGPHGGNMDIIETRPKNTVFLPVFVPGGYLYLGDAHAAMGHGELSATGLEMPALVTVTVDLLKRQFLPGPRICSPDEIMTIATGCPMERSIAQAYAWLVLWLERDYGWNRWQAYDLLTHVGEISVGYYGIGTVAAKLAKRYALSQR